MNTTAPVSMKLISNNRAAKEANQNVNHAMAAYADARAASMRAHYRVPQLEDTLATERDVAIYHQPQRSDLQQAAVRYACDARGVLTPDSLARAQSVVIASGDGEQMLGNQRVSTTDGSALFALRRHLASGLDGARAAIVTGVRW